MFFLFSFPYLIYVSFKLEIFNRLRIRYKLISRNHHFFCYRLEYFCTISRPRHRWTINWIRNRSTCTSCKMRLRNRRTWRKNYSTTPLFRQKWIELAPFTFKIAQTMIAMRICFLTTGRPIRMLWPIPSLSRRTWTTSNWGKECWNRWTRRQRGNSCSTITRLFIVWSKGRMFCCPLCLKDWNQETWAYLITGTKIKWTN